jgi:hypothetical protein
MFEDAGKPRPSGQGAVTPTVTTKAPVTYTRLCIPLGFYCVMLIDTSWSTQRCSLTLSIIA